MKKIILSGTLIAICAIAAIGTATQPAPVVPCPTEVEEGQPDPIPGVTCVCVEPEGEV